MSDEGDLQLARSYLAARRLDEAARLAGGYVADHPDSSRGYLLLAEVAHRRRDHLRLVEAARTAVGLAPDDELGWRLLALGSVHFGDLAGARRAAQQAVALAPRNWLTHAVAADVTSAGGEWLKLALEHAQEAVRLAPLEPGAHQTLGNMHLRRQEYPAAEAAYREALRLDPTDEAIRNNLAVVALRRGRPAQAAAAFTGILRGAPDFALAESNLLATSGTMLTWLNTAVWLGCFVILNTVHAASDDGSLGSQDSSGGVHTVALVVAIAVGLLSAVLIWRFLSASGRYFRRFVATVPRREPPLAVRALALVVAYLALVAAVLVPPAQAGWAAGLAFAVVLASNIVRWVQLSRRKRRARR